jgi:hypothetical protein
VLRKVDIQLTDLPGDMLGSTSGKSILIDLNAAGAGWFVDSTPRLNHEFVSVVGELFAKNDAAAAGRVDLLTVVAHELGHVLGLGHTEEGIAEPAIMADTLQQGIRRLPSAPVPHGTSQIIESVARRSDFTDIQHLINRFGDNLPSAAQKASLRQGEIQSHKHPALHESVAAIPTLRDATLGQSVARYLAALSENVFDGDSIDQ